MKKVIGLLLLAVALLMTGCGKQPAEGATPEPAEPSATASAKPSQPPAATPDATPDPALMEPDSVPGTVLIPHLGAALGTLPLGEEVSIVSEQDDYYLVDTSVGQGAVEKRLLRLAGQPAFESCAGYAKYGAVLYEDYLMLDSGVPLDFNAELNVLDAFDGGFRVQLGDEIGYVDAEMLSQWPITYGGNDSSDGGDISLTSAVGTSAHIQLLSGTGSATVLVEDARVYAAFLNRNDTVKVTEVKDEICTIYLDGSLLTVPRCFVALEGDAAFESYTGYAYWNAGVYKHYTMIGDPAAVLELNEEITVLGDFGRICLVEVGDTLGFIRSDSFGEQPAVYDGGSYDGNSDDWTLPIL